MDTPGVSDPTSQKQIRSQSKVGNNLAAKQQATIFFLFSFPPIRFVLRTLSGSSDILEKNMCACAFLVPKSVLSASHGPATCWTLGRDWWGLRCLGAESEWGRQYVS